MTWSTKGDDRHHHMPELTCSGRLVWPKTKRYLNRKRTDGGFRFRCTWLVGRLSRRRRLRRRWPKRTRRQCTIQTGTAIHWPRTVRVSTVACVGTSTPTDVRRVSHTHVRGQTWTSDRRNGETLRAGNNLR